MRQRQGIPTTTQEYLGVDEAAAMTGTSPWFWRRKAYDGTIGSVKLGRRLLIARAEIDRYILEGTAAPLQGQTTRRGRGGQAGSAVGVCRRADGSAPGCAPRPRRPLDRQVPGARGPCPVSDGYRRPRRACSAALLCRLYAGGHPAKRRPHHAAAFRCLAVAFARPAGQGRSPARPAAGSASCAASPRTGAQRAMPSAAS